MANNEYTVTLPDGTTGSRKSPRPYTHAVIVTHTEQEMQLVIAKYEARVREEEEQIAKLEQLADTDEARATHAAAVAAFALVDTAQGGSYSTFREWCGPYDALCATPQHKIDNARSTIKQLGIGMDRIREQRAAGKAFVYGWSMSAQNVGKMVAEAQKRYPGAEVRITTKIDVREIKPRKAKAKG